MGGPKPGRHEVGEAEVASVGLLGFVVALNGNEQTEKAGEQSEQGEPVEAGGGGGRGRGGRGGGGETLRSEKSLQQLLRLNLSKKCHDFSIKLKNIENIINLEFTFTHFFL